MRSTLVEKEIYRKNDNVIISVKDEGACMTPEQIQNIMNDEVIISSTTVDKSRLANAGRLSLFAYLALNKNQRSQYALYLNFCPPTEASYISPPFAAVKTITPFLNLTLAEAPAVAATADACASN